MTKTAFITGASRGIGYDIALKFAKEGYNIIATCMNNEDKLIKLRDIILSYGVSFDYYVCDHSKFDTASYLINEIQKKHPSIDILINNVGISITDLHQNITEEQWNLIWNTNVTSVISLCKEVIPPMLQQGHGKIINISSVWGISGASCECAYSATKGAINSFTKALAKELGPSNIQVNAIACGIIDTDMNSHLSGDDINAICEDIPSGRIGTPSDVAEAVFSITTTSPYLTGQIITVDGAWI